MAKKFLSWAHVLEADPLSGKITHSNCGYDEFDTAEEAYEHARAVANANLGEPGIEDAYGEVVELDEDGEPLRSWSDESKLERQIAEKMADLMQEW